MGGALNSERPDLIMLYQFGGAYLEGEYNLNVEGGIAVLRGQLNSEEDIQLLISLVGDVPDVRGVESFLHTPGTVAPNKEEAIEASDAS